VHGDVSAFTTADWNDSEDRFAIPDVRHGATTTGADVTDFIRSTLRRLDRWTLVVFNPYYASDHRR
jgi:hypothetical protein